MNTGMIGADPDVLRGMAAQFDDAAHQLMGVKGSIQPWVDMTTIWLGLNYHLFKDMWEVTGARTVVDAASIFHRCAEVLRANADAQVVASAADAVSFAGTGLFCSEPHDGVGSAASGSPSELFEKLHNQDPDSADGFRIEKVLGDDGEERFIVYINGTGQGGEGSHTWGHAFLSQFGTETETQKTIHQAMVAAGIGAESEVLYVGYSQGGMIAQNLAATQEFGTGVVLAQGSPRTSSAQIGYDVIHINVFGDEVVTGVGPLSTIYDGVNDYVSKDYDFFGTDHVHTHVDLEAIGRVGAYHARTQIGYVALDSDRPMIHTDMDAYARATKSYEESTKTGDQISREKLVPFMNGTVMYDTK